VISKPVTNNPFKVSNSFPAKPASSSSSAAESSQRVQNPFQKQTRNQPYRPYLQIALVQDRQFKSQALARKDGDSSASDANLGPASDCCMVAENSKGPSSGNRRTILPYGGAKSDGLLNKHAFISCNVIAAAERRKRDSYSRSSTTELPLEKVIDHLVDTFFLFCPADLMMLLFLHIF